MPQGAALPKHLRLGLTLPGMRELLLQLPSDAVEQVNAKMEEVNAKRVAKGKPPFPMSVVVNGYINQFYISCWEKEDNLTVCQRLQKDESPHVGVANVFVSWFLETKIDTLLDALDCFIKQKGLREEDVFFWVCDYVIRQTEVKKDLESLGDCVSALGHTVLLMEPWHAPKPLKRAYCIKEVYHTQVSERGGVRHGHEYDAAGDLRDGPFCTRRRLQIDQGGAVEGGRAAGANNALAAPQGPGCDHTTQLALRALLSDWQAECLDIEDKNAILLELEQGVGTDKCNSLVIGLMRKALVAQTAAYQARQRESLDRLFDGL
eukprot:scaffold104746_cov70-Phaeocystis_antarctica.AAC.2